jgi:hypothetical protein
VLTAAGSIFQYVPPFFLLLAGVFYMGFTFWGVYGLKGKSRCAAHIRSHHQ